MAASLRESFAGQGKNVHRTLCMVYGPIFLVILNTLLLNQGVPVMAGIPGILPANLEKYPHSAEIGKKGLLVYILDSGERPEHLCVATDYNCTTPHGLCIDRNDKYRFVVVEDAVFEEGRYTWFCGLEINDVAVDDVGKYEIWKRFGVWNAGFHDINFAVWERDASGRICQTSYDETSKEIINNCTSLTTHSSTATTGKEATTPATPSGLSTTTRNTTEDGSGIRIDPGTTDKPNYAQPGKLSSAVGIPVTVVVIIILIICGVVYLYKKRSRRELAQYQSPALATGSPNTTTVLNINVNNADGCSIEIDGETAHFREDSEFNT